MGNPETKHAKNFWRVVKKNVKFTVNLEVVISKSYCTNLDVIVCQLIF